MTDLDETTNGYLNNKGSILINFKLYLLKADIFLHEIEKVPILDSKWFKYVPKRYERAIIGFYAPVFQKMSTKNAENEAWRWTIYASGLYNHLPEKILTSQ